MADCEEPQDKLREAEKTIEQLKAEVAVRDATIQQQAKQISDLEADVYVISAERDDLLKGFVSLYNAVSKAFSSLGKEEKKKADTWSRGVNNQPTIEERAAYMSQMGGFMVKAISEVPSTALAVTSDESKRFSYTLKTRNENRAEAIVAHVRETGKETIKSTDAQVLLETHEGKKLDSKCVWRALKLAGEMMKAPKDKIGKIARLKIPDFIRCPEKSECQDHDSHLWGGGGGDRGTVPRPRKDRVLWDPS